MNTHRWERPAAGREPAAAALLAWLADPAAPRMCLVTGATGGGKSTLLAWLVAHGARPGTPQQRRIHAIAPLQGLGVRAAMWTLANQLNVTARAPGELITTLAADPRPVTIVLPDLHAAADPLALADLALGLLRLDHVRLIVETTTNSPATPHLTAVAPAVMNLDHEQWTDPERLAAWKAARDETRGPSPLPSPPSAASLDDPDLVCADDPIHVTSRYEDSQADHGGLRTAWMRAGQALIEEPKPATRALILLAALGDSADPRLQQELAALAADAHWTVRWSRVAGDVTPPWPGPALCLAAGHGVFAGKILLGDHQGIVRIVNADTAAASSRLPRPFAQTQSLAALPEGAVLTLNRAGHLEGQHSTATRTPSGFNALLDDGPTLLERIVYTMNNHLVQTPGSTLTTSANLMAVADETGTVHALWLHQPTARPKAMSLHNGPATALAALDLPGAEDSEPATLLYSGGADGRVRAWAPGRDPLATPIAERPVSVTALAAAHTSEGPALAIGWADGLIEYHLWDTGTTRTFRPGPPVRSLAATTDAGLVIGSDDMVICLRPH
ncbi:hypothetical protein [Streptomyces sp. NPDC002952]|uniref:hypothetical protein n=1 Tax=Streptomyces sp. NPDC002952 TaxID=3364673 RepID=UPI00369992FA